MTIHELVADGLPRPAGHYSHAVRANGLVFVAGLLPVTADGRALAGEPFEVQAAQVLANLDAVLATAGTSRQALAQVRVYITDIACWAQFNQLYAAWIGDRRPARCVVPVPVLHHGVLLEIEAVAAL